MADETLEMDRKLSDAIARAEALEEEVGELKEAIRTALHEMIDRHRDDLAEQTLVAALNRL